MQICELMNPSVRTIGLEDTVEAAALAMDQERVGALPVADMEKLHGMLTDRDIVTRVVAAGKDPKHLQVQDVMSERLLYCFADEDSAKVANAMAERGVLRMPVVDREKRLVGIVSAGDLHRAGITRANDAPGPDSGALETFADGTGIPGARQ